MRGIRWWIGWFAASVFGVIFGLAPRTAVGQLVADLVQAEQVRRAAQAGTATLFVDALGSGKDQEAAAAAIVEGARTALQREVNRHLRQIRTGVGTVEEGYASEAAMVRAARGIEQGMMDDLRALTSEREAEGFERFARDRRRRALMGVYGRGPVPMDFRVELARLGVDVSGTEPESVGAALTESEKELDGALVAVGAAETAYIQSVRSNERETQRTTRQAANAASARLEAAQSKAWRRITARLEPRMADALLVVRVKRWFEQAKGSDGRLFFGSDETPATVREVLALELTEAQRTEVQSRLEKFQAEYLALLKRWTTRLDDAAIAPAGQQVQNELFEPRDALRAQLEKDVLAVLTDVQREAYDVSPLVEESSNWGVEQEPEVER